MGFIEDHIISELRHSEGASFVGDNTLRDTIWYSSTHESYAQRSAEFDDSWLYSSASNDFVKLALKDIYKLETIVSFSKLEECHNSIDCLDTEALNKSMLYIYLKNNEEPLFRKYIDGLRNALAHGTFNKKDDRYFFISQQKPKATSQVKFYLQCKEDFNTAYKEAMTLFRRIVTNDKNTAKYDCIKNEFELSRQKERHYSKKYKCYILIDDDFRFNSNKHVEELSIYLQNKSFDDKAVILVNENLGNTSFKNRSTNDGSVVVIQQSKLIEHFKIHL